MKVTALLLVLAFLSAPLFAQKDQGTKEERQNNKRNLEEQKLEREKNRQEEEQKQNPVNADEKKSKIDPELAGFFAKSKPGTSCRVVVSLVNPFGITFNKYYKHDLGFLAKTIEQTQQKFLAQLPRGMFNPATFITLQYAIAGYTDINGVKFMETLDSVSYITEDRLNHPHTVQGAALMGITEVINTRGFNGAGITVATIDGALRTTHSEFANANLVDSYDFSNNDSNVYPSPISADASYHGTGVFGIIHRIAPGAAQAHYQVFDNSYDSVIANAINRCITKNSEGINPPIRIISMSLGGGRYYSAMSSGTIGSASANALTAGILSFAASGNDGWTNSMGSPAAHTSVISVSSVMDANNANYSPFPPANVSQPSAEKVAGYWLRYADVASFLDIFAPSEEVLTADEYGGVSPLGGTSSATPEAAAATAVLLQGAPSLIGNKAGIVSLYQTTGANVPNKPSTCNPNAKLIKVNLALNSILGGGSGGGGGGGGSTGGGGGGGSTGGPVQISSGGSVSGSLAQGEWSHFYVTVPSGATALSIAMSGNGDADLYVKKGTQPTSSSYDFRPYLNGSAETVTVNGSSTPAISSGTWYVSAYGYASSAYNIVVNITTGSGGGGTTPPPEPEGLTQEVEPNNTKSVSGSNLMPTPNVPLTGKVSSSDKNDYFRFDITGPKNITIELDVPNATDYDVYLYRSTSTSTLASGTKGSSATENVSYTATTAGTYYVRVTHYSGTSAENYVLTVNWY